ATNRQKTRPRSCHRSSDFGSEAKAKWMEISYRVGQSARRTRRQRSCGYSGWDRCGFLQSRPYIDCMAERTNLCTFQFVERNGGSQRQRFHSTTRPEEIIP